MTSEINAAQTERLGGERRTAALASASVQPRNQFTTTVTGGTAVAVGLTTTRNRWPSGVTSQLLRAPVAVTGTTVKSFRVDTVPENRLSTGFRRHRVERVGEPEVEHFDRSIWPQLDVRGLEIPVNDAVLVRGFEGVGDLACDRQRLL